MLSTVDHPQVVEDYLQAELHEQRIAEVTDPSGLLDLQVSPIRIIPKWHSPNKWSLIIDLSSPKGSSVNDGIDNK